MKLRNQRGVTLLELLIVIIISVILVLTAMVPFVAERLFWGRGRRRVESQQDAQIVMRAIERVARGSKNYTYPVGGNPNRIDFTDTAGCTRQVQLAGASNTQLQLVNNCVSPTPPPLTLIDGNRSRVTNWVITPVNTKLVTIQLRVAHRLLATDPREENETLVTEFFLRNA